MDRLKQRLAIARQALATLIELSVLRACFQVGVISDEQTRTALAMTDDRNRTSHTYNEQVAAQIFGKIADYANLMDALLSAIEKKTS